MARLSTILQQEATSVSIATNTPTGTLQAVASGTLANGDKVVVNSDGTVSVVNESLTTTPTTIPNGSENIFVSGTSATGPCVAVDPFNSNRIVISYRDWSNAQRGAIIVGNISGTTVTFGEPYTLTSSTLYAETFIDFDPHNENKLVVIYSYGTSSQYGRARIVTLNGTTVTLGTEYTYINSVVSSHQIVFDQNTPGSFVIAYTNSSSSYYGYAIAGTVDGSTLTFGSAVVFRSSAIYSDLSIKFNPNTAGQFVIAYQYSSTSYAVPGTVSGTTITYGTQVSFNPAATYYVSLSFDASTPGMFVVAFMDDAASDYGKAVVGIINGTTISFGSEYTFKTSRAWEIDVSFLPGSPGVFVVVYRDPGNSDYGKAVVGTVSGTSISYGSTYTFNSNTTTGPFVIGLPNTSGEFLISYYGTLIFGQASVTQLTSTLTANNYIGISDGAYSDAETATIQLAGAVNNAQTGLTAGNKYYLQTNGNLSLTPDTPSVFAGTAISSTGIIVKG